MAKVNINHMIMEMNLLGHFLLGTKGRMARQFMKAEDFDDSRNRTVFSYIKTVDNPDLLSVTNAMHEDGVLETVGGAIFLAELTSHAPVTKSQEEIYDLARLIIMTSNNAHQKMAGVKGESK